MIKSDNVEWSERNARERECELRISSNEKWSAAEAGRGRVSGQDERRKAECETEKKTLAKKLKGATHTFSN
jgi:hypothetical protein